MTINKAQRLILMDNSPEVELFGPHSNVFRIFITDEDGDIIALSPREARTLQKKLTKVLAVVTERRYGRYRKKANKA